MKGEAEEKRFAETVRRAAEGNSITRAISASRIDLAKLPRVREDLSALGCAGFPRQLETFPSNRRCTNQSDRPGGGPGGNGAHPADKTANR